MISDRGTIRLARPFDFVRLQEMKPHSAHGLRPFYQMNRAFLEKPNALSLSKGFTMFTYFFVVTKAYTAGQQKISRTAQKNIIRAKERHGLKNGVW